MIMYHSGNQLIDPKILFEKIHLQKNMHAADFGCGRTGHLVFPASKIIGDQGIIYAVDIIKDVLEEITKRARAANTANIYSIWSDIEKPGKTNIPENSLDVIFLINILWHFSNFDNALNEAKRLLKKKARILIVDWKKSGLPIGPKEKDIIDFNKITRWALNNNFAVQEHFEISDYNQGLVLYRNE